MQRVSSGGNSSIYTRNGAIRALEGFLRVGRILVNLIIHKTQNKWNVANLLQTHDWNLSRLHTIYEETYNPNQSSRNLSILDIFRYFE